METAPQDPLGEKLAALRSCWQKTAMKLDRDLESPRALRWKGGLFLVLGLGAGALLMVEDFSFRRLLLLGIAVWAFCRTYYFLFYVLERYAGRERRYAGLFDAARWALRGREKPDK